MGWERQGWGGGAGRGGGVGAQSAFSETPAGAQRRNLQDMSGKLELSQSAWLYLCIGGKVFVLDTSALYTGISQCSGI